MTLVYPVVPQVDESASPADPELITAVRTGDTRAYALLYERHEPAARGLARQLAQSPHDVDDLIAEAFAKVFRMLRSGGGPDTAFRAYLLTTLRHARYERARRDRRLELSDDMARHDQGVPWTDPVEAELDATLAARAFARLPERWQAVLWYSEVEQESTAQVGQRLGLRPNAVAALAYRAREALREAYLQVHLSECGEDECRATVDRLGGWTRQRLSATDSAQVRTHLAACASCRRLAAELGEINSGLRGLLAPLVPASCLVTAGAGAASGTGTAAATAVSAGGVVGGGAAAGVSAGGVVGGGAAAGVSAGVPWVVARRPGCRRGVPWVVARRPGCRRGVPWVVARRPGCRRPVSWVVARRPGCRRPVSWVVAGRPRCRRGVPWVGGPWSARSRRGS
jgi:RNA polymerase sigma factor (sigma-70 family)